MLPTLLIKQYIAAELISCQIFMYLPLPPPLRKRRAPVPYKQAYGRSKPPVAYTRPLRADDVALTGATKITSE